MVIETTSRKTRRKDTQDKPLLYARLGVKEYFVYDPLQEYLDPPLQGYRLGDQAAYAAIPPDEAHALISEQLGLRLRIEQGLIQFYRLDTGERLLTAEERSARDAEARQAAEAEIARLRAELARRSQT